MTAVDFNRGSKRLVGLDVLRGCAAAAVMLHHHGQYYDELYPGRTPLTFDLGPGHFGVELFFIISGFVILMTTERSSLRTFVISRISRLMPVFLVALLLATVVYGLWPMPPLGLPTFHQFLANLTMAPNLFGENGIDMPYWTLTYELVFYAYMALLLRFQLLGSIERLGLLGVLIGCLMLLTGNVELHRRTSIVLLVYYSSFFLVGICLYRIYARAARPITYLALCCAVAVTALGGGEQTFSAPGYVYFPLAVVFAGLVWLATSKFGYWLAWRPLVFLGEISYPLYLIHVALGWELIRFGVEYGWSTIQGVIVAGIASVAAATVLHYFVEVPGMRWTRTFMQRRGAPLPLGDVPKFADHRQLQ